MAVQVTTAMQTSIANLYIAILGRNPEPAGFGFWVSTYANADATPAALDAITETFAKSPEFTAIYDSQTTESAVALMYQNILERAPDASGQAFWVGVANNYIAAGKTVGQAYALTANDFIVSAAANTGTADSALILANEAAAVAAGTAAPVTTYTLTTSVDTFTGVSNMSVQGTGTTFTPLDSVTATGVNNSITIVDSTGESASGVPAGVQISGVQTANITALGTLGGATSTAATTATVTATNTAGLVTFTYGGVTGSYTSTTTATDSAANLAAAINAIAGSTVAVVSSANVEIIEPGTTFSGITFSGTGAPVTIAYGTATIDATTTTYDVSGWTGLTQFNGNSFGGEIIKAAATTSLTLTDSALGAGSITTTGGNNVAITAAGQTTGTVTVGSSTASAQPAGTVSITSTAGTNGASVTAGAIQVNGGTSVTVAQSIKSGVTAGSIVNQSAVSVTGNAATTSVSVTQANTAANQATVNALSGANYAAAVSAAPGVTPVVAAVGQVYATAKTASPAVTQGNVVIADKNGTSNTAASTISTVTLNGYGNVSSITTSALSTLNVGGTVGYNSGSGAALALTDNLAAHATTGTTLALNIASLVSYNGSSTTASSAGTISDTNGTIEVLNITNTGTSIVTFSSAELGTLTIAGTGSLTMPVNTTNMAALTSLSISGAVSVSDGSLGSSTALVSSLGAGLNSFGANLAVTSTTTGNVTARIDATNQAYAGGGGNDTIVITADATQVISGGAGVDELVLGAAGSNFTAAYSGRNISGFETLGLLGTGGANTVDVAQLFGNDFTKINIRGAAAGTTTVNNVAQNAAINFANTTTAGVAVNYIDESGATDAVTVTIGSATNSSAKTVNSLTVADANGVGIGTLNFVSNNSTQSGLTSGTTNNTDGANIVTTLVSNNLANLNVSGNGDLTFSDAIVTSAAAMNIASNGTGTNGLLLAGISGANSASALTALTFTGSNKTTVTALTATDNVLTLTNSGTSTVTVTDLDATVDTLTLVGKVKIGTSSAFVDLTSTTGITVSASTDNSQINIVAGAAGASYTNTYTLGNGYNNIDDNTILGDVVVSTGTGQDKLTLGTASNATATFTVNLAVDDVADEVVVYTLGSYYSSGITQANYVITGAGVGDIIAFGADTSSATSIAEVTAGATLALSLTALATSLNVAHEVNYVYFGGNTYVGQTVSGTVGGADTTVVELVGLHTFTATAGEITIAS